MGGAQTDDNVELVKLARPTAGENDITMAPDRGHEDVTSGLVHESSHDVAAQLAERANEPQNFTIRSLLVGCVIGIVITFSNTYFGLQTGWISGMAMPSALLGFAWFKATAKLLSFPFTPVENVLIQTVASSVGTMPLGCGFVGVIPALEFLLKPSETPDGGKGLDLPLGKLIVWALGICFFGVVFAVPLRREVIIREKLKFPSGTATALMIGVLNGGNDEKVIIRSDRTDRRRKLGLNDHDQIEEADALLSRDHSTSAEPSHDDQTTSLGGATERSPHRNTDDFKNWRAQIRLLVCSFSGSAAYTVITYFVPQVRNLPVFGMTMARDWVWTLNPSPAYIGQGIIMGPATTLHMLIGAVLGWGALSPLAKHRGWAPGPVDDWETGSKGWIVWVSLAIMLADALVSLGWLVLRPIVRLAQQHGPQILHSVQEGNLRGQLTQILRGQSNHKYRAIEDDDDDDNNDDNDRNPRIQRSATSSSEEEPDAPPEHLISNRVTAIGLVLSLGICVAAVHYSFANLIPFHLTLLSLVLALLLSIMGVRALGETDLNPVSGISKLTQLLFALATPTGSRNAVVTNLLAGAISESGALQAGDLLQDLKTGHLLGASPKAQFYGQILGSALGAVVSAVVYKMYTHVYEVPSKLFDVPTAHVWVSTARLVTGHGLPDQAAEWAAGAALVFAGFTILRIYGREKFWRDWVPGGIAVAVGMYNVPSFTLARTIGGLLSWYWMGYKGKSETPIIILASGLILGEGLFSILNLLLASLKVPHL